jgi:hypothetical protein
MSDPLQKRPVPALLAALTFVAICLFAAHAAEARSEGTPGGPPSIAIKEISHS